ncbi:cytochrome P450 [Melanomma pulvis-pyrius CBS 109.77]|uniref:Cytochrome P450 n=1 Tax=Melanomma pulvis-pyrius CBS 109.77 TaxID=1314802 RepID=A0A6A6XAX4_9PLEO|nr:cytochrome P450 [Melanomma pulvis-pyrius CBS 109.77]
MFFTDVATSTAKALLGLLVLRCVLVWSYRILFHPLHPYPGPFIAKLTDIYGAYHAFRRELHWITQRDHEKYGSVIRQGPNKLVFNSVAAIHDIYQNERLLKAQAYLVTQISPKIFNLFNVIDRKLHRTKRRIIGQGLNERAMRKFQPVMMQQVNVFLRRLVQASKDDTVVDMTELSAHLSLDISVELGFGYNLGLQTDEKNRWIVNAISTSNWRINLYIQWPFLKSLNVEKLLLPFLLPRVLQYHRLVRDMIKSRSAIAEHAKPDLFSFVSGYKDPETGESLSPRELWSESTFLIPAAGDTTSTLMAALFFYLSRNPGCYKRLATEIRTTFSSGADIRSGIKLSGCTYLRACIDEALRITPPTGTTLWRDVATDDNLAPVIVDGHIIPPGTRIGVNLYTIHHNEAYFPSPFVFKPERWTDDSISEESKKMMNDAFTPFSIGYRGCAGKPMVYLESSMVIAKALWFFDFEQCDARSNAVVQGWSK